MSSFLARVTIPKSWRQSVANGAFRCSKRSVATLSQADGSGVVTLQMHNDPINVLSIELMRSISDRIKDAEATKGVRAVVLSSQCRVFSAGLDLEKMVCYNINRAPS